MADNSSLAANMQKQFSSVQDPFGVAKLQAGVDSPFNGIQGLEQFSFQDNPGAQPMAAQQPSMDALTPKQDIPFQALAKQLGLDISGLHNNADLAKLQLGERLKDKHGPTYLQTEDAARIFKAFDAYSRTREAGDARGDYSNKQENTQEAVTARTLAALMEGAPRES